MPIRIKLCRSSVFSFLQSKMCANENAGVSERALFASEVDLPENNTNNNTNHRPKNGKDFLSVSYDYDKKYS